jgi:hypothetical protein
MYLERTMKLAVTVLIVLMLAVVSPLEAAAPRLLMVYGAHLQKPVLLSDWGEIFKMFTSTAAETNVNLADRPFYELALFWGPEWNVYVNDGKPLDKLRPEDANQKGRFYPAFRDKPAVISAGPTVKQVPAESLRFLERSGIRTRVPVD